MKDDFDPEKSKFRFKLYAPEKLRDRDTDGMNKFYEKDYQGKFPSMELARKVGSMKAWYQIVEIHSNKVIEEKIKFYDFKFD
jgi:hypothetical protein